MAGLKPDAALNLRGPNQMKRIFLLMLFCFIIVSGTDLRLQARAEDMPDADIEFKEQQKQLNDQLIDYAQQQVNVLNAMKDYIGREQYDSAWDYLPPDMPQFQQQLRRYRGDDEFNYSRARLDSLKLRTLEAEAKKNDLKTKVLYYNKQVPEWWEKAEAEFIEKRRQAVQSGLRR